MAFFFACVWAGAAAAPASPIDALRTKAEAGDPRAQYALGMLYARSKGAPENNEEAVKWVRKAASDPSSGLWAVSFDMDDPKSIEELCQSKLDVAFDTCERIQDDARGEA